MNPLGMSTSWNAASARDGKQILDEIRSLGFTTLEVDYRVTAEAALEILNQVRRGSIKVASVHNFTPLPPGEKPSDGGGHKLSLTSLDESERQHAVDLTLVSAELAQQMGARALILHLGTTDLDRAYFKELSEAIKAGGVSAPDARRLRERVRTERRERVAPFIEAGVRSLLDILGATRNSGLVVCIENRYFYHQLPLPEEALEIMRKIPTPRLRYWHDVGHAHVQEVLGFQSHVETLRLLKDHLFGMHIHDSVFTGDHRAPGTGEIDFAAVLAEAPAGALKVMELAPSVTREEIAAGLALLEGLGVSPQNAGV
jgi:sugar phosphate isomerase/epimerase